MVEGKKAIITGASNGLGLEIAKLLIDKGWEVISISRSKPEIDIGHIKADVMKDDEIDNVVSEIKEKHKDISCLINCAGVFSLQADEDLSPDELEKVFRVNVLAPMKITSGIMALIKNNNADVANIGSTVSFKAYENQATYSTSKWAIRGYTNHLQTVLKKSKSRVLGFYPGGFKSKFFEKATFQSIDLDKFMEPSEIAKAIVFALELPKNMEVSQMIINRKA